MDAPLYNALMAYSQTKHPFHMPGHKLGTFGKLSTLEIFKLDVTEANGLDNLYEAEGIIKEALLRLSTFYGTKETLMLTNGSTAGILASILALCKPGDKLIVARNCHHSVWHGLVLAGVIPIYITPTYDEEAGFLTTTSVERVKEAYEKHPECKGVLIVSPTYEGVVSDIATIAAYVHQKGGCLIVDEAHGAHFVTSNYFPKSSVSCGADVVIQSMHKTLPTLTQSALLHRCTDAITQEKLIKALRMVQTSSPSYALMGVMDYIRATLEAYPEAIESDYIQPLQTTRKYLQALNYLRLYSAKGAYEGSKLIIQTHYSSIDGYTLAEILEETYAIVVEAALPDAVILMTTLADNQKTLHYLTNALLEIDKGLNGNAKAADNYSRKLTLTIEGLYSSQTFSPRDVYFEEGMMQPVEACEELVSKENIMLYPPGIPIVCIGEVITQAHIALIQTWQSKLKGITVNGDTAFCQVIKL